MFWKGKALSESLGIRGQLYPNLFAMSLSDLHSYIGSGKFSKVNCYSTFFDLISGKGNTPAVFKNYGRKLGEKFISATSSKTLYDAVKDIHIDETFFVRDILNRLKDSEFVSGGVRAEFRFNLSDFYSMAFALESFFSEDKFKELTFVFESQTIVSLSSLYVEMIHKQISANFLKLLVDIERISITNHVAMERIATISVLESLLTTTLFTGFTYSFAGSLVWNRSTVEFQSMELMKYIRVLDRPVFELEFFGNNIFKLSATNEILNTIFSKLFKTRSFNFPPVNLVIQFNEVNVSDQQKARLLWEIYFKELNPNAFLASSRDPRWKLVSLNREKIGVLLKAHGKINIT